MENHEKITKKVKQTFVELEKYTGYAKVHLRILLKDLPKEEMIARINKLNLSDKSLNFLCEGIALETEDYEICDAVQSIQKERALHPKKDELSHLTHTII